MLHVQVLHIQNGFLPPTYSNEWRDNGGSMTVNRLRPRPNLSVLTATRKRIKIFFTLLSLFGFSYLTFSFENVYLWWVQFSPIIHIKTPKKWIEVRECFTSSFSKAAVSPVPTRRGECQKRYFFLVWIISKNAPKCIDRLF